MRHSSDDGASMSPETTDPSGLDLLSAREEQVLSLASGGLLDKQIALELGVSLNTLRTYWGRIRAKVGKVPRSALAVMFVERKAKVGAVVGASWHIDLDRWVLSYYGDRDLFPAGETDMEEVLDRYHPDDRPRVRGILRAVVEQDMPSFSYVARIVTDHGLELTSAYVEIIRDADGQPTRLVGRNVPILNLTMPARSDVYVGSYSRDIVNGTSMVDDGFCTIYRIDKNELLLEDIIIERLCPEYRARGRGILAEMVNTGRTKFRITYRLCFDNGDQMWATTDIRLEMEGDRPLRLSATVIAYL